MSSVVIGCGHSPRCASEAKSVAGKARTADTERNGADFATVEPPMSTLFEELSRVTTYEYTQDDVVQFEALHEEIRRRYTV